MTEVLMDADDLVLFRDAVAGATDGGGDLDPALAALGWSDALADDPRAAVAVLFERQGAVHGRSGALGAVLVAALGLPSADAVVLPAIGRIDPPGVVDGDAVVVDGLALGTPTGTVVVPASDGSSIVACPVDASALDVVAVEGVDAALGLVRVSGRVPLSTSVDKVTERWPDAVARAQVALGHELVGASRTMLALAREHALERVQFDRPISQFQAVRHRLAETLVAIETAEALLDAAWLDGTPTTALMAKAQAGRSAKVASKHCQQVCAGIGFTTEHDLHLFIRRVLVLDALLGSSVTLTRALGTDLVTARALPPLLPL